MAQFWSGKKILQGTIYIYFFGYTFKSPPLRPSPKPKNASRSANETKQNTRRGKTRRILPLDTPAKTSKIESDLVLFCRAQLASLGWRERKKQEWNPDIFSGHGKKDKQLATCQLVCLMVIHGCMASSDCKIAHC